MDMNPPKFQSLRNIRDNALLFLVANEYMGEDVFLKKFGTEIEKNIHVLRNDITSLKKQYPGRFAHEVDTDTFINRMDDIVQKMLSNSDEIAADCVSGKLGKTLESDTASITEAVEKIWVQVRGTDVKYTKTDSIGNFFSRLNIFSGIGSLFSSIGKIAAVIVFLALSAFCIMFFTMENVNSLKKENDVILSTIEEKKSLVRDIEQQKKEVQQSLTAHEKKDMSRGDRIAVIDYQTKIQDLNNEIHKIEGQIDAHNHSISKNNEKIKEISEKPFLDRLLRK